MKNKAYQDLSAFAINQIRDNPYTDSMTEEKIEEMLGKIVLLMIRDKSKNELKELIKQSVCSIWDLVKDCHKE